MSSTNYPLERREHPASLAEFQTWADEQVEPFALNKSVVLASGGSSRWYFLEHGSPASGYGDTNAFRDYGYRGLLRIVQQASMMLDDGVRTVFAPGFVGGQEARDPKYVENMKWAYEVLIDEQAQAVYEEHRVGVMFKGGWEPLFEILDAPDLTARFRALEETTTARHDRRLVWFIADDLIPASLTPIVASRLETTGRLPDRKELSRLYYGRDLSQIDIFISNNKLSVREMCPPLLTLNDLYFTISPSFYMDKKQWRHILYDHLFTRRGYYRDYTKLTAKAVEEMRDFYMQNRGATVGVGMYHAESQTWRPTGWPHLPQAESNGR